MKNLFVSFSGGRTSAFMCQYLQKAEKYKDVNKIFIFANTGKERQETLDFVNECDIRHNLNLHWIEAEFLQEHGRKNWFKKVSYETASRNGEPFEAFIKKERLPNSANPGCSSRLKEIPMHKFIKHELGINDYYTAIGIRADETHRINWESAKRHKYIYPLAVDFRVDSKYIRKFWSNQDFDLNLKDYEGNCDMCWKKSKRKLYTLIQDRPELIEWWSNMEQKYGNGHTFYRNNDSAIDLIEFANNRKFSRAVDSLELTEMQKDLFTSDLDEGGTCFCSF